MPPSQMPSAFIIDVAKISDYLLNIDHPVGKSKAAFFISCGFLAARPDELAKCLFAHAVLGNLAYSVPSSFGFKWIFEGAMNAPSGTVPGVRSVWIVRPSASAAELVTAYKFDN